MSHYRLNDVLRHETYLTNLFRKIKQNYSNKVFNNTNVIKYSKCIVSKQKFLLFL